MIRIPISEGDLTMVLNIGETLTLLGGRFDPHEGNAGDLFQSFMMSTQTVFPQVVDAASDISRFIEDVSVFIQKAVSGKGRSRGSGWRR